MATFHCGKCTKYWALRKPKRNGDGFIELKRGYCLAKSTFAKNKAGDNNYPPGARIADLPNGMHDIKLVREDQLELTCAQGGVA